MFLTAEIERRDRPTLASESPIHIYSVDSVMHARKVFPHAVAPVCAKPSVDTGDW
jgi:hypothetical protein